MCAYILRGNCLCDCRVAGLIPAPSENNEVNEMTIRICEKCGMNSTDLDTFKSEFDGLMICQGCNKKEHMEEVPNDYY